MNDVLIENSTGVQRLYMRGDLQFDAADERQYHEPLALLPGLLAAQRRPQQPLRALILGGGDGLAARELLKISAVESIKLVDIDREVLRLGRGELSALNRGALHDPRLHIHCDDARLALGDGQRYDIIVMDLTYPRRADEMPLWRTGFFRRLRLALAPDGVAAINAVSPEHTPRAYGCIGATLQAAGLRVAPYTFELPSFRAEGYGRWGFFFATRRAIEDSEWEALALPTDSLLTAEQIRAARLMPKSDLFEAAVNKGGELLAWLKAPEPVAWKAPFGPPRFLATDRSQLPPVDAADHFGRWMRSEPGRQSVENLIACLPGEQRGLARDALFERRFAAEKVLQELDLKAFVTAMRRRAALLPRQWVQELESLQSQAADWRPSLENATLQTYRVLAIVMILLLMAHLMFPDNLYAKGYGGSGGGGEADFSYSDPSWRPGPFRFRTYGPRAHTVYDSNGAGYQALTFSAPGAGQPRVSGLLALNAQTQLLESGSVAYTAVPPGYKAILEHDRLRILTLDDQPVLELHPGSLPAGVQQQLMTNQQQIGQAIADHQRWLDWTAWAHFTATGQEDAQDLDRLKKIQQLLNTSAAAWAAPIQLAGLPPVRGYAVMVSVYIDAPGSIHWVDPQGVAHERAALPARSPTREDRFFYAVLKNFTMAHWQPGRHLSEFDALLTEWDRRMPPAGDAHASW